MPVRYLLDQSDFTGLLSMIKINPKNAIWPLGIGTAFSLLGDATLYTVLPTHTSEVGVAVASVGIILGINRAIRIFLNGPTGMVYDRLPRRPLFVAGLLIGAISTTIYAISQGLWLLLLGRLLWGVSWSLIWVGGTTIILDIASDKDRGRLMGLYQTWFFLGQTVGALAGGILTDQVGYAATMWIGTLLALTGTQKSG
jgi:MFS family permease